MAEQPAAVFNPFDPAFRKDPFPVYRSLRDEDPVHRAADGTWVLTRHADCALVLRDHRFSSDQARANVQLPDDRPRSMLFSDPPDHTRLRNLVNRAFTARRIEELRPRIHEVTDQLCDEAAERGEVEAIADYAYPLPMIVIAEMLGVPAEDRTTFREWTAAIAVALDPILDPETGKRAEQAGEALWEYFSRIVSQRRSDPRDDLISALIHAEQEGHQLTTDELLVMCNLLLIAGHETTVNLIGNGLNALLHDPEALAALRDDSSLDRTAVEELLRYDGPVQLTARAVTESLEIDGHEVAEGDSVVCLLGAANRDPGVFTDPDRLALDRHPNPHLTFGGGIHFCLGAPLARLEGQIAIGTLIRRFPNLALAAEPEQRGTIVLRGLSALNVTLG